MNLAALTLDKRAVAYFLIGLIALGGTASFFQLGWLEDPEFTVKVAAITVPYPGATAKEVELEVTDLIETKLQEMGELRDVWSYSRPGLATIKVEILPEYWADRLPQVWDVVRKKVRDVEDQLPPGAGPPRVGDDFGFVLGFLLALTGDGYDYAELEEYAKELRKEMSLVPGVSRVDLWGAQAKRVFVEVSQSQLAELGITREAVVRTLSVQNAVVDAGRVDLQDQRFRISPSGAFESAEDIADLVIRGDPALARGAAPTPRVGQGEIIRLGDIATVRRGYAEPPQDLMRYNGEPAIGIAAAPASGSNVVEVGEAVDARLAELMTELPVGIEIHKISWQAEQVRESIFGFMINLAEAVVIVLAVLALTMGLRMGVIIGLSGLVFAILGTFVIMAIAGIDLQRISLGALIIAMGMMVDNAIVVADGFVVRLNRGVDRRQAALESASQPAFPLLGATVVAMMAFYPIYVSTESTGEYARSLFQVVAIALLFSWLLSQTLTPLLCFLMIPEPDSGSDSADPYSTPLFQRFRELLGWSIRNRTPFMFTLAALLVVSIWGFRFVNQNFFPDSSRQQLMIDYWLGEGTRIEETSEDLRVIEAQLLTLPQVDDVSTFVGRGPPRFYLPVDPEMPYTSYGQIIANTKSLAGVDQVIAYMDRWLLENHPQAMARVRKYGVGSWNDWKLEVRFSGPSDADPAVLRRLAAQGAAILQKTPLAKEVRTNWRRRVRKLVPEYAQERARWAGVTREDVGLATKRAFDGVPVGYFRELDDLIPMIVRNEEKERRGTAAALDLLQVGSALSTDSIPLSAVARDIGIEWEESSIHRFTRRRAITLQCSPNGVTFPELRAAVLADFDAIALPPGYQMEWDGEWGSTQDSQAGLVPGLLPTLVIMTLIIVILFNAFRPTLIIFVVIPFVMIGITLGLIVTRIPFGFMSLLGAMSLSGMMIKNSVVLLDEVNLNLAGGAMPYNAVVEAAISRLRPVVNAAATTILGMAPLLQDGFWVSMAITIMAGLLFGTLLTMVAVPVLYATLHKIPSPARALSSEV